MSTEAAQTAQHVSSATNGLHTSEKTFSSYNAEQSKYYSQMRRNYHPDLYASVIKHHTCTGGELNTLLDIGCGPGLATKTLAPQFDHAIGLDPSEGMIETARSIGGETQTGEAVKYERSTAESLGSQLDPPIADSSIDLITAANAAHWFDMPGFWNAAARVLKPNGTVAIWASGEIRAHSDMPNADKIQDAIEAWQDELKPYFTPGNFITRDRYQSLPLPWNVEPSVTAFNKSSFVRKDWNSETDGPFFGGEQEIDLKMADKMFRTGSPITRWMQANPEKVRTAEDPLNKLIERIKVLLNEGGMREGEEKVKGTVHGVVLFFKKTA